MILNYVKKKYVIGITLFLFACSNSIQDLKKSNSEMPPKILWAWERKEDLRFINVKKFGVAFLAQTLILEKDAIIFQPRRQPLQVAPETFLIAVTRIETSKDTAKRAVLSEEQRKKVADYIKKTLELSNIKAVQIDFDAVVSERAFYQDLINDLRKELPENFPLSITALASWCIGDAWFSGFPIFEAVPMAFDMGADDKKIREFLGNGNDWNEPLCRESYGVSVEEPLRMNFKPNRRFYYFKSRAWEKSDLEFFE